MVATTSSIAIKTLLYLGAIGIIGFAILLYLTSLLQNNPDKNIILMIGVALTVNIMIFTFCVITFSNIKFKEGPVGPVGIRGNRGPYGTNAVINKDDVVLTSGEQKIKIKTSEMKNIKKPVIIDD